MGGASSARRSAQVTFAATLTFATAVVLAGPSPQETRPTAQRQDAERFSPVVPERLELEIPSSSLGEVFVRKFAVRVDNGKEFAKLRARVLNPAGTRWLSLRGSSDPVTVVSPSTQVLEVSIDAGMLEGDSDAGIVEITGARPEPLRLPVTLRVESAAATRSAPAPQSGELQAAGATSSNPDPRPGSPIGPTAEPAREEPTPGRLSVSHLSFRVKQGGAPPAPQLVEALLPVIPQSPSPVLQYLVTRKPHQPAAAHSRAGAEPREPAGGHPCSKAPSAAGGAPAKAGGAADRSPDISWISVDPEGACKGLENETKIHRVTVTPASLPPGDYFAEIEFRGIDFSPIVVVVEMEVR